MAALPPTNPVAGYRESADVQGRQRDVLLDERSGRDESIIPKLGSELLAEELVEADEKHRSAKVSEAAGSFDSQKCLSCASPAEYQCLPVSADGIKDVVLLVCQLDEPGGCVSEVIPQQPLYSDRRQKQPAGSGQAECLSTVVVASSNRTGD